MLKNNTSGMKGIGRYYDKRRDAYNYQSMVYNNEGRQVTKSFSCQLYGDDHAKQLAINWRDEKKREFGN